MTHIVPPYLRRAHSASHIAIYILGAVWLLLLPISIYAHKGLAPLFVLAALAAALVYWRDANRRASPGRWTLGWLLAVIVWVALSCVWSPRPWESASTALSLAAAIVGGWLLQTTIAKSARDDLEYLFRRASWGFAIGFVLLAVERLSGGWLIATLLDIYGNPLPSSQAYAFAIKPGVTVAEIGFWPLALYLGRLKRWWITPIGLIMATAVIISLDSDSSIAALLFGLGGGIIAGCFRLRGGIVLGATMATFVMLAPFLARELPDPSLAGSRLNMIPNSGIHRIYIWRNTATEIEKAPLIGHGFDSSRMLFGHDDLRLIELLPDAPERRYVALTEPIPLHPHNLVLQVWLELGFAGASLLAIGLILLVQFLQRLNLPGREQFAVFGALSSIFVIANLSYGAWQSWWLAALFLLSGVLFSGVYSGKSWA